jgi:hypothetical protein
MRDETEDTIMPGAASSDVDTRPGAAARSRQQPQAKRKKTNDSRGKPFRAEHLRTFGLKMAQCESKTGKIASVASRFCFNFGREPRADASEAAAAGETSKYKTKKIVKLLSAVANGRFYIPPQADAQGKAGSAPSWKPLRRIFSLTAAQACLTRTLSTRI